MKLEKNFFRGKFLSFFFPALALMGLMFFLPAEALAGTYWVSPEGAASWSQAQSATPLDGSSACSLKTANTNVQPGDTVYLRAGTYYPTDRTNNIHPGRSGTSGARITYEGYNGENVVLDGTNSTLEGMLFCAGWDTGKPADGRSYITVRGINFAHWNKLGEMRYASFNEITDCDFSGHKTDGIGVNYNGFFLYQESSNNWIHGNTWHSYGHFVGQDGGCLLNIGHDTAGNATNSGNDYNTVEDNHFYASGHHIIGINNAKYNIVRNNYFHNESWSTTGACADWPSGKCGYRVVSMTDASGLDVAGSNLLEDNNIAYGAQYGGPHLIQGASGSGLTVDTKKNIVRYNNFFGNVMAGIRIGSSIATSAGNDNHVYNNTFYYNGYNLDSWGVVNEDDPGLTSYGDGYRMAFYFYSNGCDGATNNNVIKNNLAHDVWSETNHWSGSTYYPAFYTGNLGACNTLTSNWGNTGKSQATPFTPFSNPLFVDPDISDPMALIFTNGRWAGKPNLSLQENSPAIDGAAYLTQANGAGSNSITLIVDDAKYFQDGTWGSGLARAVVQADWIAIGTVLNTVQISSVNYDTNTITLVSPVTWLDDASIWLYKKSNGDVVLSGTGPDYGAYEYFAAVVPPPVDATAPTVPTNFSVAAISSSQINLSWTASTDAVGVVGYRVYRNGSLFITTASNSYSDTNLPASTAYTYYIVAYDAASNFSPQSSLVSATTQAAAVNPPSGGNTGGGSIGGGSTSGGSTNTQATTTIPNINQNQTATTTVLNQNTNNTIEESKRPVTSLSGASSAIVEQVTAAESQTAYQNNLFASLSAAEKAVYTKLMVQVSNVAQTIKQTIANFIKFGTPTTIILGSGERAGVIGSFRSAFTRLPDTELDWQDVIKIANGRWTKEKSSTAETKAKIMFKKVYLREPNMEQVNDDAAVNIMAYGLRPAQRNLKSEKAAILSFKDIFKKNPSTAAEWDIVRAIAYSGAKR